MYKKLLVMALSYTALVSSVKADMMEIEYSSFYSHVRKLDDESMSALQFAFGFINARSKQLCHINKVYIHTQKVDLPIEVTAEQRFVVPTEKALKMAKALVRVETQEPANQCDMSVQLETKPEFLADSYTAETLQMLFAQYQAFFDGMGSFLSFLMPSVSGLSIDLGQDNRYQNQGAAEVNGSRISLEEGKLHLDAELLEGLKGNVQLPAKALRITALVEK